MLDKKRVTIYSDGAAKNNPAGPGGYGAVIQFIDRRGILHEKELSQGFAGNVTNNQMELMGVTAAFEALNCPCSIDLYSDSKYVVSAFNEKWIDNWKRNDWCSSSGRPVANRGLWERLLQAAVPHDVRYHWVKGHRGNPANERCDALANAAASRAWCDFFYGGA